MGKISPWLEIAFVPFLGIWNKLKYTYTSCIKVKVMIVIFPSIKVITGGLLLLFKFVFFF